MRLAVFTSKYPARVATFFERDMRSLMEQGVEIEVFAVRPKDPELWRYALDPLPVHHLSGAQTLRPALRAIMRRPAIALRDGAALMGHAARWGPVPLAKTAYVLPKAWAWASSARRFDHVLAYWGNYAGTCAYLFHRLAAKPVPFSIWLHAGTDLYYWPIFLRQKLTYAHRVITCCEFNRSYLLERYADPSGCLAEKIFVSHHGLDLPAFPFRPDGRPPARVLAVGRLARDKGFHVLLQAARELDAAIELVGDGPERSSLERQARRLGIAHRVRFRGWLPFPQVRAAMVEATLLAHPSTELGDGLPNVLREAMALGTPVVASRVAGIPEALDWGRCGTLVPPGDAPALARAIAQLLSRPDLRREHAHRARARAEVRFDLRKNGAGLAATLRATRC